MNRRIAVVALAVLTAGWSASGSLIAYWNLAGEPGNQASTAGQSVANLTAQNVARGAGLTGTTAANSISASGWDDLAATDYFSFGFTVAGGYSVDLQSLVIGTRSSSTGPGSLGLFYSGDGFANNLYTLAQPSATFVNSDIDLSALTALTGTVGFRIIALNNTSAGGGTVGSSGTFRITNYFSEGQDTGAFGFTGSVVPEPGTMALIGFGGLAALLRRRR